MEKDIKKYIKEIEKPYKAKFWGEEYTVTPKVVYGSGDGRQLIGVEPIDTRPQWYLVQIDSSIDIEATGFNYDEMLLQPIEEEFGDSDDYNEKYDENGNYVYRRWDADDDEPWEENITDFPMLNWCGGRWWVQKNFGSIVEKEIQKIK